MKALQSRAPRGFALIEGLVSIVILSFGLLGLARFQAELFRQAGDTQSRWVASGLADELLSYVRVDAANAACYTLPQAGACNSAAALTLAADWASQVGARGYSVVSATLTSPSRMTASLTWTSRGFGVAHNLEATTDVRP